MFGLLSLLFSDSYSRRARRDQYSPSTTLKNLISPINHYGTCFSCDGSGKREFECSVCGGSGTYSGDCRSCEGTGRRMLAAKPCFTCQGHGKVHGKPCRRCDGTGVFQQARQVECRACQGSGQFSAPCRCCDGEGEVEKTCRKCGGSGWHRF